jgi:hypothetical protein
LVTTQTPRGTFWRADCLAITASPTLNFAGIAYYSLRSPRWITPSRDACAYRKVWSLSPLNWLPSMTVRARASFDVSSQEPGCRESSLPTSATVGRTFGVESKKARNLKTGNARRD